jgi:hypothetical protein
MAQTLYAHMNKIKIKNKRHFTKMIKVIVLTMDILEKYQK